MLGKKRPWWMRMQEGGMESIEGSLLRYSDLMYVFLTCKRKE